MKNSILKLSCATTALLFVASCSSSGDGGSGGGTGTAVNPLSAVSNSSGALTDGKTANYNETTKTISVDGAEYTFSDDPTSPGTHLSTDSKLFVNSPKSEQKYSFMPAYVIGENLRTDDETISATGIALFGDLTPVADLPTSKADYSGNWYLVETIRDSAGTVTELDSVTGNGFTATADFGAAQTVTGSLSGDDGASGALSASISENTFNGTITMPDSTTMITNGGFFGPSAEELTGTGQLTLNDPSGETADYSIGYYGSKEVPDS